MPFYNYHCHVCNERFQELNSMSKYLEPVVHEKCGTLCERSFEHPIGEAKTAAIKTRLSSNLGFSKAQYVAEKETIHKMHPGATFRDTGYRMDMEIRGRGEKLKRMKERSIATNQNLVELD